MTVTDIYHHPAWPPEHEGIVDVLNFVQCIDADSVYRREAFRKMPSRPRGYRHPVEAPDPGKHHHHLISSAYREPNTVGSPRGYLHRGAKDLPESLLLSFPPLVLREQGPVSSRVEFLVTERRPKED
jgi:hypothetical protein